MGADFIGWRGCSLQQDLGVEGFLGKVKLRAYRGAIEARVPEEKRASLRVNVAVTGRGEREMTYAGILAELGQFERGVPECAGCPLAQGGAPVSCYRYVTYPIDAVSEEVIFDYFLSKVGEAESLPKPDLARHHPPRGGGQPVVRGARRGWRARRILRAARGRVHLGG
jgi:hypothetical protein